MAVNVEPTKVSSDLSVIVVGAISSVKKARSTEQARKEAEFQRAIADGLSYEEQVAFREKQLEEEKASSFSDPEYVGRLEKSVADTKKLARFTKYRQRYADTLSELSSGKINEQQYLDTLKSSLNGVVDPDLRLEIQNDIAAAEKTMKEYRDTILGNQVRKLRADGTQKALNEALASVKNARAQALISDNQDEVTAYDETIAALNSKLNAVAIQDAMQDFEVRSATKGTNALERLDFMNSQLQTADANTPITIQDENGNVKTYASAQQFWQLSRDRYLSSTFFKDFEDDIKNNISVNSRIGINRAVLDGVAKTYSDLRSRPEIAPFLNKLDAQEVSVLTDAVSQYANNVVEIGSQNRDYDNADAELQAAANKYKVDLTTQRVVLRSRNIAEVEAGKVGPGKIKALSFDEGEEKPVTPEEPEVKVPVSGVREVQEGDTLSAIAAQSGLTLAQVLELNPQFRANPDLIRPGDQVNLPSAAPEKPTAPAPTTATTTPPQPQPAPVSASVATTTPAVTPAPAPAVTPPAQPQLNTATSVVDFLKSTGQDSSFEARKKLAEGKGITGYTGSAEQNTKLLNLLRQ